MTTSATPVRRPSAETHAIRVRARRIARPASRWYARAAAALDRVAIRGQLGPSVGYAHDRYPEPPF